MDPELKKLLDEQAKAFEDFKTAQDERLAAQAKGFAPADLTEKVDRINAELSRLTAEIAEITKKAQRPAAAGAGESKLTPEQLEHKEAFRAFLRKGRDNDLASLERKALQMGSDVDGGYLIDAEMEANIDRIAGTISTVRQLADVVPIGAASQKLHVKTSGTAARWVGESEAGGETTNPKYAEIEIFANEMEIEPWVYNTAMEDSSYDVAADLEMEAAIGFNEGEGAAFVSGTGVKSPRGFLSYTIVANASFAWNKVGYIASGASGDFAASNPGDKVIDLMHALKAQYRTGATLLMADTTLGKLRQIKDSSGQFYLFQPDPLGKFGGYVLGAPVVIDDNMPVIGANSYSIAFGNFKRAYRIVDRRGIALIRDNLTTKGTTKFNFRKRVGGGIKNFEAIKLMKFATS